MIFHHLTLLILFLYLHPSQGIFDDEEFAFVLGFPQLQLMKTPNDIRRFVVISTDLERDVYVNMYAPGSLNCSVYEGRVNRTKSLTIELDSDFDINEERSNKSIVVLTNGRVHVYGMSESYRTTESFHVLPVQTLGSLYYAVTWNSTSNDEKSEILIIGLSDNTRVNITQPQSSPGSEYNIELEGRLVNDICRFETLQIKVQGDLSGTRVEADKPIAVLSGNEKAKVFSSSRNDGRSDYVIEMLPPVDKWGKHFVIASTPMRNRTDFIKIVGISPETQIYIQGKEHSQPLETLSSLENYGFSKVFQLEKSTQLEIISSTLILVAQFTQNTETRKDQKSDASMVIVPPVEQWGKSYSFGVQDTIHFTNYIIVMINDSRKAGILLDNTDISARLQRIGETEYATGFASVSPGPHTLRHTQDDVTFGALLYGGEVSMAYYHSLVQYINQLNQDIGDTIDYEQLRDPCGDKTTQQSSTPTTPSTPDDSSTGTTQYCVCGTKIDTESTKLLDDSSRTLTSNESTTSKVPYEPTVPVGFNESTMTETIEQTSTNPTFSSSTGTAQCCVCNTSVNTESTLLWNNSSPTLTLNVSTTAPYQSTIPAGLHESPLTVKSNDSIIKVTSNVSFISIVRNESVITVTWKESGMTLNWNEDTFIITPISEESSTTSTNKSTTTLLPENHTHSTERLEKIRKALLKDKKSTTMHKRSLVSAKDDRPSVRITGGIFGAGVLIFVSMLFVVNDMANLYQWCLMKWRNRVE